MRFKTSVRNISTFTKLTASLSAIHKHVWLRLSPTDLRFVIQSPDCATQVWATLPIGTLFTDYRIASNAADVINLEVPLAGLHRGLRSCSSAVDAVLRLTKRASDGTPILCLTITTSGNTLVTQEIPVRVQSAAAADAIQEPLTPESDVNIYLPPMAQIRSIVDRFIRLSGVAGRLEIGANALGEFVMRVEGTENVRVETRWTGLQNPVVEGREEEGGAWPKERFATVRVEGREWAKVLKVGMLAKRAVACFCDGGLVVYVFLGEEGEDEAAFLTYYMSSYSA